MALALKKRKEDEEARLEKEKLDPKSDERGRRIDKGKAKVRVVGFDGTNQDGVEEQESVFFFPPPSLSHSQGIAKQRRRHGLASL